MADSNAETYDVVAIGAGAAGLGVYVGLVHAGIQGIVLLERRWVGVSFEGWPAETQFITP